MPELNKQEALAFVEAMRLAITGKVGFRWLSDRMESLRSYIETTADENALLNNYIDHAGVRADFEAFAAQHDAASGDDVVPDVGEG
jgi:hypothetical protein